MTPDVPFALQAASRLLVVAAALALAGSALTGPLRAAHRLSTVFAVAGAVGLGLAAALKGVDLAPATSLQWLTAGALLAIAAGLADRRAAPEVPGAWAGLALAPVGGSLGPSVAMAAGGLLAAGAALRLRALPVRGVRLLLVAGLGLLGLAGAFSPAARTSAAAAVALLSTRAAGAMAILLALAVLGRISLLGKVVALVSAGVLVTAIVTAGVVGSAVAAQLSGSSAATFSGSAGGGPARAAHIQQILLELLFGTLVVTGLVVSSVAVVLGRRVVTPVLRLTGAAREVAAGNLPLIPVAASRDEIGQLAVAFGAMTGSLRTLTGDLRRTAEQEAATGARLAGVLDAMSDALVVTGPDDVVGMANPAAVALLGDAVGHPIGRCLRGADGKALAAGSGVLAALHGPVPVSTSVAPLGDGRGSVWVVRDVTAQRQLEAAKTEFLSNVSHELRAPLTPIQGYADMLRRRPGLPAGRVHEMAESIATASRRMARVVGQLMDVAALDAGRVLPVPAALDVAGFVDDRLTAWRVRRPDRAGDLRRRVSADLPPLFADAVLLARALDEVVDNALAVTGPGDPVTLLASARADGQGVRLAVRDRGPGLDEQARAKLFTDFSQADGSVTRGRAGLGLGLAFVRRVAAVLGAGLEVVPAPGGGTVFALELPAGQQQAPARRRPEPATNVSTGRVNAARPPGGAA